MPIAGRSLRASCPSLARCFLRFAILAARRKQRRLPGTGSPSLPSLSPVAQVFNLCLFTMRIALRSTHTPRPHRGYAASGSGGRSAAEARSSGSRELASVPGSAIRSRA